MNSSTRGGMRFSRRFAATTCLTAFLVLSASIAEARPAETYKVKPGDTLSHIALSKLGKARKWVPLYEANRKVLGSNPHLIFPGQVLVLTPVERQVTGQVPAKPKPVAAATKAAPEPQEGAKRGAEQHVNVIPAESGIQPPDSSDVPHPPELPTKLLTELPAELPTESIAGSRDLNLSAQRGFVPQANPWVAAGASTLFPGAGQALMGDWARSGLYVGAAAVLYGTALYGLNSNNTLLTRTSSAALLGLSLASPIDAFFGASGQSKPASEVPQKEARK